MSAIIGSGVSIEGIIPSDAYLTFNLASGITAADLGKAVTIDSSGNTKVKLAGTGDWIFGRLETVENRVVEGVLVGTIITEGGFRLPKDSGVTVNVGDTVCGDAAVAAGNVKTVAASTDTAGPGPITIQLGNQSRFNVVTEVGSTYVVVLLR